MSEAAVPGSHVILVGVIPGQPDDVLMQAMRFADRLDAELVCASVTATKPDAAEKRTDMNAAAAVSTLSDIDMLDPTFADHLIHLLSQMEAPWILRVSTGDPVDELTHIATEINAELIVVGTRNPGLRAGAREFFGGSVAVHLAHRQHRPVLIIPLAPTQHGTKLPWEEG